MKLPQVTSKAQISQASAISILFPRLPEEAHINILQIVNQSRNND